MAASGSADLLVLNSMPVPQELEPLDMTVAAPSSTGVSPVASTSAQDAAQAESTWDVADPSKAAVCDSQVLSEEEEERVIQLPRPPLRALRGVRRIPVLEEEPSDSSQKPSSNPVLLVDSHAALVQASHQTHVPLTNGKKIITGRTVRGLIAATGASKAHVISVLATCNNDEEAAERALSVLFPHNLV